VRAIHRDEAVKASRPDLLFMSVIGVFAFLALVVTFLSKDPDEAS
jgi:hypothetical protein